MPFPTAALSAGQLNLLRNTAAAVPAYRGAQYVSADINSVVLACRITSVASDAIASFSYGSVSSGSTADVKVGMTIWISRTNDIRAAYWAGRIRAVPTGTTSGTIYINETSAPLAANDYVFVVADFRFWPKLGREFNGVFYTDYDVVFRQLLPRVTGLKRAYANWVTNGFYEIDFSSVQGYATTSGATISSYAWDAADGTYVSGNASSQNPIIKFPPGERHIYLTVTDSGGRTLTRAVKIFAHDPDTYPPALGFNGASWGCSDPRSGWEASCEAFDGVDDLLDGTLIVIWSDETIGGTDGSIGDNVNWVGNIRQERNRGLTDEVFSYDADASFTLEGTAQQLAREHKALIPMANVAAPTIWGEITNLTPWRAMWYVATEYSTLAALCDIGIDDTSNTFLTLGLTTQGNSLLDVFNDIGVSINAHFEFAPDGSVQFVRDMRYRSTADRNAALVVASWTTSDFTGELTIETDHAETVGRVDSSGGTYNSTAAQVTPLLSLWPGVAQNYPDGQTTLTRQILAANVSEATAQDELSERAGRMGAISNPVDRVAVLHPDSYGQAFLVPSLAYYWKWILDDTTNIRGRAYTSSNRFFLMGASMSHDNAQGVREVRSVYIEDINEDTLGAAGIAVHYPPQGEIDLSIPDIPPFDAFPALPEEPIWFDESTATAEDEIPDPNTIGGAPPRNGNTLFFGSASQAFIVQDLISAAKPKFRDITPVSLTDTIVAGILDQRPGQRGAWLLTNNTGDTTSSVWYTEDVYSSAPDWTKGATISGLYTVIRQTSGGIAIYCPNLPAGSNIQVYDFTTSDGGWQSTDGYAVWVPGSGWYGTDPSNLDRVFIKKSFTSTYITSISFTTSAVIAGDNGFWICPGEEAPVCGPELDWAFTTYTKAINGTYDKVCVGAERGGASADPWGYITSATITVNSPGGAVARFSTDNGVSWGLEVSAGTTPGSTGGFDAARAGGVTIAAADAQANIATSLGGVYSSLGAGGATSGSDPILLILPYYAWGSTTVKNYPDTTPDYLLGSAALVSGEALWKVTGAGVQTAITDSTGGNKIIPVGPNAGTTLYGTKIAYIGSAGGTRYLSISANGGTSWSRVAIGANAVFVRVRRGSATGQIFLADGATIKFSRNFTTTLISKGTPSSGNLTWLDPLG